MKDVDLAEIAPTVADTGRRGGSASFVFREILRGLYNGRLVPGQKLIEADLTREYGVSRGSVREALNRLSAEGVVTLEFHRGARIRQLSLAGVRDVLLMMEVLVGLACRQAAEKIGEQGAKEMLSEALDNLQSSKNAQDYYEFVRARNFFYRTIVRIGGNSELARVFPSMNVHLVRNQMRTYASSMEQSRFKEYSGIAKAILSGDPKSAENLGKNHVADTLRNMEMLDDHGANVRQGLTRE